MLSKRTATSPFLFLTILSVILFAAACAPASQRDDAISFSESKDAGASFITESTTASASSTLAPQVEPERFARADLSLSQSPTSDSAAQHETGQDGATRQRLIVRTVDMTLVVDSISAAIDDISAIATDRAGWVISSRLSAKHQGSISIRVPADRLDQVIRALRARAIEVQSENVTSRDVTDEFIDIQSRITNFLATEEQLRLIMERPGAVQDILAVQKELTIVRQEIELLQGRSRFLEQTSSTALISIFLELAPAAIEVDGGTDQIGVEGEPVSFRATFTAPDDITDFIFQWDFGDGTPIVTGTRTAPTVDGESRTTATVTHVYGDKRDSPFITTFEITGTGEAGIAEGEDTVVVTVSSVPNIQVIVSDDQTVTANDPVTFEGSFTRPEELASLTYRWDFGDGLESVTGILAEGETTVIAEHVYSLPRHTPYTATLTITGETDYGAVVKTSDTSRIRVISVSAWSQTVWDVGETLKAGVRALSAVIQTVFVVGIWLVIFSPLWLALLLGAVIIRRRLPRRRSRRASTPS